MRVWLGVLVLLASLALGGLPDAARAGNAVPLVEPYAVDITAVALTAADGNREPLGAILPQEPSIVHFWATWCAPCREELPALARFAETLASRGQTERLIVIAVEPSPREKIDRFLLEAGIDGFVTWHDREGKSGAAFGLFGMPATVLLDGAHLVVGKVSGALDWDDAAARAELEAHLRR